MGVPSCARPLPIPPMGRDDGEVMRLSCVVRLILLKVSRPASALALGLVFFDQLGLGRLGLCWSIYCGPHGPLTNQCFETPWGYNPNSSL